MKNIKNNDFNTFLKNVKTNNLCYRAPLWICKACNYRCKFCYHKKSMQGFTRSKDMKEHIDEMLSCGFKEIELTGGEPTTHPDFFEYCKYITSKCGHVSCLSNGSKLSNFEFASKAKECGLNEVMFSVHSAIPERYDEIVQHRGAFAKLLQAIENCQSLNMRVRVNCTVHNDNYSELPNEFLALMQKIQPFEINFILINYWTDNTPETFEPCKLKECSDAMRSFADKWNDKSLLNFRYVPFCYFKGYEKYICDYSQLPFDVYDWSLIGYKECFKRTKDLPLYILKMYESLKIFKENAKSLFSYKNCADCSHKNLCDGMKRGMNTCETFPYQDEILQNPLEYREKYFSQDFCGNNVVS